MKHNPSKTILVDFDGCIAPDDWPNPPGPPYPHTIVALQTLYARGFRIVIFTARMWRGWDSVAKSPHFREEQVKEVQQYLEQYHIPYNKITNEKEPALWILDDRCIQMTPASDWMGVTDRILNTQDTYGEKRKAVVKDVTS